MDICEIYVLEVYKSMRYLFLTNRVFFFSEIESMLQARPLERVIGSSVLPASLAPHPSQLSSRGTWSECIWWQNLAWRKEREKQEQWSYIYVENTFIYHFTCTIPLENIIFLILSMSFFTFDWVDIKILIESKIKSEH